MTDKEMFILKYMKDKDAMQDHPNELERLWMAEYIWNEEAKKNEQR